MQKVERTAYGIQVNCLASINVADGNCNGIKWSNGRSVVWLSRTTTDIQHSLFGVKHLKSVYRTLIKPRTSCRSSGGRHRKMLTWIEIISRCFMKPPKKGTFRIRPYYRLLLVAPGPWEISGDVSFNAQPVTYHTEWRLSRVRERLCADHTLSPSRLLGPKHWYCRRSLLNEDDSFKRFTNTFQVQVNGPLCFWQNDSVGGLFRSSTIVKLPYLRIIFRESISLF